MHQSFSPSTFGSLGTYNAHSISARLLFCWLVLRQLFVYIACWLFHAGAWMMPLVDVILHWILHYTSRHHHNWPLWMTWMKSTTTFSLWMSGVTKQLSLQPATFYASLVRTLYLGQFVWRIALWLRLLYSIPVPQSSNLYLQSIIPCRMLWTSLIVINRKVT